MSLQRQPGDVPRGEEEQSKLCSTSSLRRFSSAASCAAAVAIASKLRISGPRKMARTLRVCPACSAL
jgi:hypothetical protein